MDVQTYKKVEDLFYEFLIQKKGYKPEHILRNVRTPDRRVEVDYAIVSEKMEQLAYVEVKANKQSLPGAISALKHLFGVRPQNVKYYCVFANKQDKTVDFCFFDVTDEVMGVKKKTSEDKIKSIMDFHRYDYFEDIENFNHKNTKDISNEKQGRSFWKYYILIIVLLVLDGLSQWTHWEFTIPRLIFLAGGIVLCLFGEGEINGFYSTVLSFDRAENRSLDKLSIKNHDTRN